MQRSCCWAAFVASAPLCARSLCRPLPRARAAGPRCLRTRQSREQSREPSAENAAHRAVCDVAAISMLRTAARAVVRMTAAASAAPILSSAAPSAAAAALRTAAVRSLAASRSTLPFATRLFSTAAATAPKASMAAIKALRDRTGAPITECKVGHTQSHAHTLTVATRRSGLAPDSPRHSRPLHRSHPP